MRFINIFALLFLVYTAAAFDFDCNLIKENGKENDIEDYCKGKSWKFWYKACKKGPKYFNKKITKNGEKCWEFFDTLIEEEF